MAYGASYTYSSAIIGGRRHLLVTVAETEGAAASEFSFALGGYFPSATWKVVRYKAVKTSGTEATIAPVFGSAANPTSGTIAYVGGLGAAGSQDSTNSGAGWVGSGNTFYGRTVPNAGADNVNTTQIYLVEGWE